MSGSLPSIPQVAAYTKATGAFVYPDSAVDHDGLCAFLIREGEQKRLVISGASPGAYESLDTFQGDLATLQVDGEAVTYRRCPQNEHNAAALRGALPWLRPRPLGLHPSAGFGDRLGLATAAHARAAARSWAPLDGSAPAPIRGLLPIFAQQSVRENARTGRTPVEVVDDAMWGAFEAGWRRGYGADGDHLKSTADVDAMVAAGYTFYTIDPGAHVDDSATGLGGVALSERFENLPWRVLEDTPAGLRDRFLNRRFDLGQPFAGFDELTLARAAVKYGRAVAHVATLYRHLLDRTGPSKVELEVSVDETADPTTHLEHLYIASELRRLGVQWVSLAPRFVGRFEKGVDYQGEAGGLSRDNLERFRADFAGHAAISRALGPYKLSLHSGSDKFSIYPIAGELAGGLIHLKTAGTSYLEALRVVASVAPDLFRRLYRFALGRYADDRASYHVSGRVEGAPDPAALTDAELPALLDQFDARQILHVTFGSVLNARTDAGASRFKDELYAVLRAHEATHYAALEAHFDRHLRALGRGAAA